MPKAEPKIEDFFQNTKSRRSFIAGENLVAYDVNQLLTWEKNLAEGPLSHSSDGLPSFAILIASWQRARDSWNRVMLALPPGPLRDEMANELQDRDESMERLQEEARAMLKEAENA